MKTVGFEYCSLASMFVVTLLSGCGDQFDAPRGAEVSTASVPAPASDESVENPGQRQEFEHTPARNRAQRLIHWWLGLGH